LITRRCTHPRHLASALGPACLLLLALAAAAEATPSNPRSNATGAIVGRVLGPEEPDRWVIVVGEPYAAPVGADGFFRLHNLPPGRYRLLIEGDRCGAVEAPVLVRAGMVATIDVDLPCPPISCPKADKRNPECVLPDPHQRSRVGSRCEVHHGQRLRLDLVPIHYGDLSFIPGRNREDERSRFPNAWPWAGGGCVIGPQRFTEVAYCRACRITYRWEYLPRAVMRALPGWHSSVGCSSTRLQRTTGTPS
jgi:hypothetical protein